MRGLGVVSVIDGAGGALERALMIVDRKAKATCNWYFRSAKMRSRRVISIESYDTNHPRDISKYQFKNLQSDEAFILQAVRGLAERAQGSNRNVLEDK